MSDRQQTQPVSARPQDLPVKADLARLRVRYHKDSYYFCDGTGMGTLRDELAHIGNVIYTPAVAGMSVQSTGRLSSKVIANIRQYLGCD